MKYSTKSTFNDKIDLRGSNNDQPVKILKSNSRESYPQIVTSGRSGQSNGTVSQNGHDNLDVFSLLNEDVMINGIDRSNASSSRNILSHDLTQSASNHHYGTGYNDVFNSGTGRVSNEVLQDEMMKIDCEICGKKVIFFFF